MPAQPDAGQNFIHALSDFWSVFFQDTTQIQSYFKGSEINIGQLYLELLETVLGTNLANVPVFSKKYYKQFTVPEDQLFFKEGESREADRYLYTPSDVAVADVVALMNRVIDPTRVLERGLDFDVSDGAIQFKINLFDTDNIGTSIENFPVRTVVKEYPAQYQDLLSRLWYQNGAKPGDYFRFKIIGGGTPFYTRITGLRDDTLLLESTRADLTTSLARKSFQAVVLRKPFDAVKNGLVLEAHPSVTERLSGYATDAAVLPGTSQITLAAEPYYKGVWAPTTTYTAGDVVKSPGGALLRALGTHISGLVYSPENWDPIAGKYLYVHVPDAPGDDGLFAITGTLGTVISLARPFDFSTTATRVIAYLVGYPAGQIGSPRPVINLQHSFIDSNSLRVTARRKHPVYAPGDVAGSPTYLANEAVVEGVDYLVDYDAGALTILTGWDPLALGRCGYSWQLGVTTSNHAYRGAWAISGSYAIGDLVLDPQGITYVSVTGATAFTPDNWAVFRAPLTFKQDLPTRQIAFWGTDVLIDRELLYKNFGYLLSYKHPSSEQYRAFLRGVAQLFVIGPTLERFESALNVMAGLPVIRDDGEVLRAYNSGFIASGTDGEVIDADEGRDGVLDAGTSTFSSATTAFFAHDLGAVIRVQLGTSYTSYVVTGLVSSNQVTVAPTPPNASGLVWAYSHIALNRKFTCPSYTFTDNDKDGVIYLRGSIHARNNGYFRIVSVDSPSTVTLAAPYGFTDDVGLSWSLSRTNVQTVTTSRATYQLPLNVPIRADIGLSASVDALTFASFETITDAVRVLDYVQDPVWWHNTTIPPELTSLFNEASGRRIASPVMIEHRLDPLDHALVGDFGLNVGADTEGRPGIPRTGAALWFGGNTIDLLFPDATHLPTSRDLNQYVEVRSVDFTAQFKIIGIASSGTTVQLENFPPAHYAPVTSPQAFTVTFAPLLYRRTVGFVLMDRFLKYHALSVQVNFGDAFPASFLGEATDLLRQAKPGFTYVYLQSPLSFTETMTVDDSHIGYDVGVPKLERLLAADNDARIGLTSGLIDINDGYRFTEFTQAIPPTPGTYPLTPSLPGGTNVRFHAVKGWFDLSVLVGGKSLTENVHYTFDREHGAVTLLGTYAATPIDFNYVAAILRSCTTGTLDQAVGETALTINGSDPTTWWATGQTTEDAGFIDRAVQLTIGP